METNNLLLKVKQALNEVIMEFQPNPFNFFYEEDIRATLYCKFKEKFKDNMGSYGIDKQFKDLIKILNGKMDSNIVKAEYPTGFSKEWFDIAVLHPNHNDSYKCPVQVGIEIKLGSKETKMQRYVSSFLKDIESLAEYQKHSTKSFTGIALYFYQTILDDSNKYFCVANINELKWEDLNFETNKIYALIVTKDKLYKISEYKIDIKLN